MITRPNPRAVPLEKIVDCNKEYLKSITKNVTAKIAQFVVISGKYIPIAEYNDLKFFFKNISTNCTNAAMTNINNAVRKNTKSNGTRTK
jgi:Na+-translocating ferredoxin:NAD+ oxidoreductase RnfA subunit